MAFSMLFLWLSFLTSAYCGQAATPAEVFVRFNSHQQLHAYQVIDVRPREKFDKSHLLGSRWIDVNSLDDPDSPYPGKLGNSFQIQRMLSSLGLDVGRTILIVGSTTRAFGADGRLFWILHRFGPIPAKILDGGFESISVFPKDLFESSNSGRKEKESSLLKSPQSITLSRDVKLFSYDDFKEVPKSTILDVRTLPEYMGATPFGSSRGGHIPGAKWVPWNSFFDEKGRVLKDRKDEVLAKISGGRPIVYCTAGYRSALVFAILLEWGLDPINYDGSWYEYSLRTNQSQKD